MKNVTLEDLVNNIQNSDYVAKVNLVIFSTRCALINLEKVKELLGEDFEAVKTFLEDPLENVDLDDIAAVITKKLANNPAIYEDSELYCAGWSIKEALDVIEYKADGGSVDLLLESTEDLLETLDNSSPETIQAVQEIFKDMIG